MASINRTILSELLFSGRIMVEQHMFCSNDVRINPFCLVISMARRRLFLLISFAFLQKALHLLNVRVRGVHDFTQGFFS